MASSVAAAALSALSALRSAGDDVDAVTQACATLATALRPHAAKLAAASCSDTLPMLAAALRLAVRCAHPAAAAAAASALRNAAICPEAQASPAAGEAVDAATAALRCFCSDAAAASAACGALAALAAHAGNARRCAGLEDTGREGESEALGGDAVAALLAAVARHDADADVAEMGLWCLHNVCRAGPAAAACVAAAGGADVARAAMQRFSRHAAPSACRSGVIQPSGDAREAREAQSGCHGVVGTALTCVPAVAAAVQAASQARAVLRALGAHDV